MKKEAEAENSLQALQASETRYRRLFEAAQDGIFILNAETGEIDDVNPYMIDMLHYSREEFLGMKLWEVSPFKDKVFNKAAFEELQDKGYIQYKDLPLETKEGKPIAVEFVSNVYKANGTKVIQCNIRNITERKEMNRKLQEAVIFQQRLIDALPVPIFYKDSEGRYLGCNSSFEEFFGQKREQITGKSVYELSPKEFADIYHEKDLALLQNPGIQVYESTAKDADGVVHNVIFHKATFPNMDGSVGGLIGTISDISDLKRAETHLETERRRYSELFQNITIGVCRTTAGEKGTFVDVNPAMVKMFEADDKEQLLALHPSDIYLDTAQRLIISDMIVSQGVIKGKDIRFKTLKGRPIWCHITSAKKVDTDGHVYFENTIEDITTRKQAEEEIRILNAELEQRVINRTVQLEAANKELETFSYSVSHDLRAPLRSIDGFSQALLDEYGNKLDDTGKTYLERVRKATQRMGLLIDDMLKLSRVTKSEFHAESIDLGSMVRAIAKEHQKSYPDRRVEVTVQEGVVVQGDPYLIQIAIENLMDNAWKFTGNAWHPRIEFGKTVRDGKTVYFIRDNGVGFDMAYVGKLFGAFQRLHTTDEFPGTGIGLATVQRVIHRHGGRVWAEGEKGKGATFYFTVPS